MFIWSFLLVFFLAVLIVGAVVAALVREKLKPKRELGEQPAPALQEQASEAASPT